MDLNQLGAYIPQIQAELDQREQQQREEEELRLRQQQELARQEQAQANLTQQPTQPVDPSVMAYNAQMESGNRPDIGFHDPNKSTAYGTYGLTAPAYTDVQRANPQFANRPIDSLTPEEQEQAAATYQQEQARQLQALGIEPTPANLRLSHLLGATGAKNYLGSGAVSPAAAAVNGGEEQLKQMANQRLNGQTASIQASATNAPPMIAGGSVVSDAYATPTEQAVGQLKPSAATTTPAAATGTTSSDRQLQAGWSVRLAEALKDPAKRDQLRRSSETPPEIRKELAEYEYRQLRTELEGEKVERQIKQQVEQGDFRGLLTEAKRQSADASPFRVAFYNMIGATDLARQEQIKLGAGQTYQPITLKDGTEGIALIGADGLPQKGFTQAGAMTPDELAQAAGMSGAGAKADYVGGSVVNDSTGQIGRLVSRNNRTMVESNGRYYPATTAWRNNTVGTDLRLAAAKEALKVDSSNAQAAAEFVGKFNAEHGTNFSMDSAGLRNIQRLAQGGQPTTLPATGQAAPTTTPTAGQTAPTTTPATGQTAPTTLPATGQTAPTTTPANIKDNRTISQAERDDYVTKAKPEITEKADVGRNVAGIRKLQIPLILDNPELAGILNGTGGAGREAANILRDIVTYNFKNDNELSTRIGALNLNDKQKNALYELAGYQNQVLPATLKANAGPGAISEAEHKINRDANVEITRVPLYAGLTLMTRDQFQKDLQAYRSDWAEATGQQTRGGEASNWRAEKAKWDQAYNNIYKARAEYIKKAGETPGAVVDAFKLYPTPVYNPETKTIEFSGYSKQAANPLNKYIKR